MYKIMSFCVCFPGLWRPWQQFSDHSQYLNLTIIVTTILIHTSLLIGFCLKNHPFGGTPIYGNINITITINIGHGGRLLHLDLGSPVVYSSGGPVPILTFNLIVNMVLNTIITISISLIINLIIYINNKYITFWKWSFWLYSHLVIEAM